MKRKFCKGSVGAALLWGAITAPAAEEYYYLNTEGAGPYFRERVEPSFFQDGHLNQFGGPANNSVRYDTGLTADAASRHSSIENVPLLELNF
jgi:hypothetical protein